MELLNSINRLEEIEAQMPFSFESLEENIERAMIQDNPHDYVAIDTTIHIALKAEEIGYMLSIFVNAFSEKVLMYFVEVNGDVYCEEKESKIEAAHAVLEWIRRHSLELNKFVQTEAWDDETPLFEYDSIISVAEKLNQLK